MKAFKFQITLRVNFVRKKEVVKQSICNQSTSILKLKQLLII